MNGVGEKEELIEGILFSDFGRIEWAMKKGGFTLVELIPFLNVSLFYYIRVYVSDNLPAKKTKTTTRVQQQPSSFT